MSHGQQFVLVLLAMIFLFSILKRMGVHHLSDRSESGVDPQTHAENLRLRDEVKDLKERIKVLERITVEKESSLSRQIDELRDR